MAKNIVIIGAGPGGYVCAIRAAQLGNTVTIIDSTKRPGGTCLNMGCIPSKNLLHASYEYYKAGHNFKNLGISVKDLAIDIKQLQSQKNQVLDELGQGIQFLFKKNNIRFINAAAQIVSKNQVKAGDEIINADAIVVATGSIPRSLPNIPVDKLIVLSSTDALDLYHVPKLLLLLVADILVWS
jgi:dihydrolipoamide dehydrogenase